MRQKGLIRRMLIAVSLGSIVVSLNIATAKEEEGMPQETIAPMAIEPPQSVTSGVLDGKTFVGEIGKQGQQPGDKDEFIFKEGKFRSTACDAYGFGDATYTTSVDENGNTVFEATTTSPTDGQMAWKGVVKADSIEGSALWMREGQEPVSHWIKGQLKP